MLIDSLGYRGGAERQFAGLAIALKRSGYNISVIAYYNRKGYQELFEHENIPYCILHNRSKRQIFTSIKKKIDSYDPDIVISYKNGPNRIACLLKALGAKWKLIVSDRNTTQDLPLLIRGQYRLLYRIADAIVSNSYSQKKFIDNTFPSLKNKSNVITNFTDTELFYPNTGTQSDNGIIKILVVGRITEQKNVLTFIEVAKILAEKWRGRVKIDWYGIPYSSKDSYADQCYTKIEQYELTDFLEFHQPVQNIQDIYRYSDIFCLPSLWEGFPNALCEAMASGLPVAASKICDNERIIKDGYNGILFNPHNPYEIARSLDHLLSLSPEKRHIYSIHARKYVVDNLSIDTFRDKYINLINQIMKSY